MHKKPCHLDKKTAPKVQKFAMGGVAKIRLGETKKGKK